MRCEIITPRVPCWRYLYCAVLSWRLRSLCQISRRFDANKHFAGVSSLPGCFWVAQTLWNLPHGPARANIWIGILQLSIRKIYNDPTDRGALFLFFHQMNESSHVHSHSVVIFLVSRQVKRSRLLNGFSMLLIPLSWELTHSYSTAKVFVSHRYGTVVWLSTPQLD